MKTLKLIILYCLFIFLNACSESDEPIVPKGDYENGYFISNEGPFQNGSGTITFVGDDGTTEHNIYKAVNGEDLGNIVNSIVLVGDNAYIIVNNSNKIVVVDRYTLEKITIIEGPNINNPRYLVAEGNVGYVSNWGDSSNPDDDFVAIIDLTKNEVINTIAVGEGPENMQIENDNLFVNLQGGWGINNQVLVINTNSNSIANSITVGTVPNGIEKDGFGNVWVLCGGTQSWAGTESGGSLHKINANNFQVTNFDFLVNDHPENLTGESGKLYYSLNGKIYGMDSMASELPNENINGLDGFYYNLKAFNGDLYTLNAKDYVSEGELKIFNLASGNLIETIQTGIIPGDIDFQ